jgi:hypothetical protein
MQNNEVVIVITLETNPRESVKKENSKERCLMVMSSSLRYKRKVKNKISILREVTENCIKGLLYFLLYAIKLQ